MRKNDFSDKEDSETPASNITHGSFITRQLRNNRLLLVMLFLCGVLVALNLWQMYWSRIEMKEWRLKGRANQDEMLNRLKNIENRLGIYPPES